MPPAVPVSEGLPESDPRARLPLIGTRCRTAPPDRGGHLPCGVGWCLSVRPLAHPGPLDRGLRDQERAGDPAVAHAGARSPPDDVYVGLEPYWAPLRRQIRPTSSCSPRPPHTVSYVYRVNRPTRPTLALTACRHTGFRPERRLCCATASPTWAPVVRDERRDGPLYSCRSSATSPNSRDVRRPCPVSLHRGSHGPFAPSSFRV